jgi:uncharacterized protein (TIGR03790 family)
MTDHPICQPRSSVSHLDMHKILFLLTMFCFLPTLCSALEPEEILVIANKNSQTGIDVAKYYMKERKIPPKNLILVTTTTKEICRRVDYRSQVAKPVRKYLKRNDSGHHIRCLVIMYGLPLKIAQSEISFEEELEIHGLEKRKNTLNDRLQHFGKDDKKVRNNLKKELDTVKKKISELKKENQQASLDSEIALVLNKNYPLSGWLPNPNYLGFKNKSLPIKKEHVLMVSRLDGPDVKTVKRIIDDSIITEKKGLSGIAYFDARWPDSDQKKLSAYALYDKSIHLAAKRVQKSRRLPVVLDEKKELFKPDTCPDAALYCGWYSLANYVDAFQWKSGAIGYHIASSECVTLKRKDSNVWCIKMLEKGIAATIGPVSEPYVNAFPLPELFFGLLIEGNLTLAECYLTSIPYLSWKMVLVGDPLYLPFKAVK